ncbi:sodium ion-translocating decarboxylase subunit beta [Pelobacter seleniigenes]|uniref:sodium ion-translocating decarboxylase subunit beta n=1 Tax=Pelobacter seleniigenes TaxID=407188 RepID=UPI0004A6FA80|nr:sodium ion-translocating decarboxylase subunit beta [Pelobacter seleniigenes]
MGMLTDFLMSTGFVGVAWQNVVMILFGCLFIYLAINKGFEPLLLLPIGFGLIVGNIPIPESMSGGEEGMFFVNIYQGVKQGIYPPLIFLGVGAMTDFTPMLSNPKLVLLGAAAQFGIFTTLIGALFIGFTPQQAGAIGIIGGADGPTAIFLSSMLAPELLGSIAIAAYSYMSLVPVIQPPIMRLLTSKEERLIRMEVSRQVSKREKIIFPIVGFLVCTLIAPGSMVLIGCLFFGNILKESMVTERLANTARNAMIDILTILLGFSIGANTLAVNFLTPQSIGIFVMGATAFALATASGVLFAKFLNLFSKKKINPLVGAAGVSAVPNSARVVNKVGLEADPTNYLLMHAMAPNVAGVVGSAIAAGVLLSVLGH